MQTERFVIVSNRPGDALFWRELLELILAGASLDLDLLVLFELSALVSLSRNEKESRAWRQLTDHQLATVRVVRRPGQEPDLPDWLEWVSASQAETWRSERAEIHA